VTRASRPSLAAGVFDPIECYFALSPSRKAIASSSTRTASITGTTSDPEQQLSFAIAAFEITMRVGRLGQRVFPVDRDFELAGRVIAEQRHRPLALLLFAPYGIV